MNRSVPVDGKWRVVRRVSAAVVVLSVAVAAALGGLLAARRGARAAPPSTLVSQVANISLVSGPGFDACALPSVAAMAAWRAASPYQWANVYIGGINKGAGCSPIPQDWVPEVYAQGWSLVPTYVGLQAPVACGDPTHKPHFGGMSADAATAFAQGASDAGTAVADAQSLRIGPGSIIYDDMEYYVPGVKGVSCDAAVAAFVSGWVQALHVQGYHAGLYESASNVPNILRSASPRPDDLWIAGGGCWSKSFESACAPYANGYVANSAYARHRLYQYTGHGHFETWGGARLYIDSDVADGQMIGHAYVQPVTTYATENYDGRLDVFARGTDGNIWYDAQTVAGGAWGAWSPVRPHMRFSGNPSVGQEFDGRLIVVAVGSDSAIWLDDQAVAGGAWGAWSRLGNTLAFEGTPAIVREANGRLDIFARDSNSQIWRNVEIAPGGAWSGWQPMRAGATFASAPVVGQNADGRLALFAVASDGSMLMSQQAAPNGAWPAWTALPGGTLFEGAPAVGRTPAGAMVLFARGADGDIWQAAQLTPGGKWSDWSHVQDRLTFAGDPVVGQDADGRLDVIAIGSDNAVWHDFQTQVNGEWSGWRRLASAAAFQGTPATALNADGRLAVFALSADGTLSSDTRLAAGGDWGDWSRLQSGVPFQQQGSIYTVIDYRAGDHPQPV